MSAFYVYYPAIDTWASATRDLTTAASNARVYHSSYCDVGESDGMFFATFISTASDVYSGVEAGANLLRTMMNQSTLELQATAKHYKDMDETTAATMDATY